MYRNGINMGQVKKQNRSSILRYMNSHEDVSRKEIAEATGLTAAAVTQICNDFLDMGLIKECGTMSDNKGAGRRKVKLRINNDYAYIVGVNIESQDTVVVISDLGGHVKAKSSLVTNSSSADSFVEEIAGIINDMIAKLSEDKDKIIGGCIAVTGEVDRDKGSSLHAYGIWDKEVPICELLEKKTGISYIIENNIDAFSLAEIVYGTGMKNENILVVKWGPGVGCTIIIDNKIYEGRHGRSAELGHFIVDKNGERCSCGRRGCLETKISYKAMKSKKDFKVEDFGNVYTYFQEEIDLFARTLVNSMTILAPNRVVLSGKLFADERVRDELISCCESYDKKYNKKRILYSPLYDKEDYIGPIATYIERELF
ncbi:MAG TPA: hypothetical protein DCR12_04340 [Lachnospiraceae bacterium]|nr:hypothetical protein [Lachnospiraceae bacterium]